MDDEQIAQRIRYLIEHGGVYPLVPPGITRTRKVATVALAVACFLLGWVLMPETSLCIVACRA